MLAALEVSIQILKMPCPSKPRGLAFGTEDIALMVRAGREGPPRSSGGAPLASPPPWALTKPRAGSYLCEGDGPRTALDVVR